MNINQQSGRGLRKQLMNTLQEKERIIKADLIDRYYLVKGD